MILLISNFPWDHACGGAFILRNNLDLIGPERVHWLALSRPTGHVPFARTHVECEFQVAPARGNVRLRLQRFWMWYYRTCWSPQIASLLLQRVRDLKPRLIWLMADFGLAPIGLRMLPHLRGHRVHVSVHDDPAPTAQREGMSEAFIREVYAFQASIGDTDFTADAVTEDLLEKTVPSARKKAVVTMPVAPAHCAPELVLPAKKGVLTVGFSGNFLGEREFICLVDGLRLWSQRTGRDWRLHAFGRSGLARLDARVEARGFTTPDEVRMRLRECDLLFLPCPVDAAEMMTSLPTKLVSYTEAGRAILAFAPAGSATERIITESGIGLVLNTRDALRVAECLDHLPLLDPEKAQRGRRALIGERFSPSRIARDLGTVLGS